MAGRVSLPRVFDADPHRPADLSAGILRNRATQSSANDASAVDLNHCGDKRNRNAWIAATYN